MATALRTLSSATKLVGSRRFSSGPFKAWLVDSEKGKLKSRSITEFGSLADLPRQDPDATVTVDVKYSTLNYKDAMIIKGVHGVCKGFPIVPGIDFSGVVETSDSPMWKKGDEVVMTGNKCGQFFDGGFSEKCRVQAEWLVKKPDTFTLEDCMTIGTAGFTAMQMVMHLEAYGGMKPGRGDVLVTGAGGGVGGMAIAILSNLGYSVVASTSRTDELGDYLTKLGASKIIGRLEGDGRKRPLQDQKFGYVVDTVGGPTLSTALAQTKHMGSVAAVGVAAGGVLDTTVYPFVLRGVRLLGVDSTLPWNVEGVDTDKSIWEEYRQERLSIWERLSKELPKTALPMTQSGVITMDEIPDKCEELLKGQVRGRCVVKVQ